MVKGYFPQIVFFPYPLKEFLRDIVVSFSKLPQQHPLQTMTLTDMVPSIVEFAGAYPYSLARTDDYRVISESPRFGLEARLTSTHLSCVYPK